MGERPLSPGDDRRHEHRSGMAGDFPTLFEEHQRRDGAGAEATCEPPFDLRVELG